MEIGIDINTDRDIDRDARCECSKHKCAPVSPYHMWLECKPYTDALMFLIFAALPFERPSIVRASDTPSNRHTLSFALSAGTLRNLVAALQENLRGSASELKKQVQLLQDDNKLLAVAKEKARAAEERAVGKEAEISRAYQYLEDSYSSIDHAVHCLFRHKLC